MDRRKQFEALAWRVGGLECACPNTDAQIAVAVDQMDYPGGYDCLGWYFGTQGAPPPRYTASLDAAEKLAAPWAIAEMGDLMADGRPGAVLLLSTDPVRQVVGVGHGPRGEALARALTQAALFAMAEAVVVRPEVA